MNLIKSSSSPTFFIICGEQSGDFIASCVIARLKRLYQNAKFVGIGGNLCKEQGLEILFDCSQLSVMGFWEVVPKVPRILSLINKTVRYIINLRPDMVITVDSWGFNCRVISKVRDRLGDSIKCVHYIAPTVWAYNRKRAEKAAKLWNHLFAILPFEPEYFTKHGLATTFVGHPFFEKFRDLKRRKSKDFKELNILLMPGSRRQEISNMAQVFKDVAVRIQENLPDKQLKFYIPTFTSMLPYIKSIFDNDSFVIVTDEVQKKALFEKIDFAIVKSGTSSVEMMLSDIPCVVAYKLSNLSYHIIKRKVKVKFISIVNLLIGREVVKEFIQGECTAGNIAEYVSQILNDSKAIRQIHADYEKARAMLKLEDGRFASEVVADKVFKILDKTH